jgi:MFS family permease
MEQELGFTPAGLGVAVSAYFAVSAFASVPVGRLVERYGPTGTARTAIVLAAACLLAVGGLARSFPLLVVVLAGGGLANALGQLASNASLAQHVQPGRQGVSFGLKQAAIPVSQLLAGASVPAVALTVGWRWAFVLAAVVSVVALPLVPSEPAEPTTPRTEPKERATSALVVIGLAAMLGAGSAGALGSFLVDSSVDRGIDPGPAGLTLTLGGAICAGSRISAGWLADRRGRGHVAMIAIMLAVGAAGLALLAVPGSSALVIGVVLGFGFGWSWPGLLNFAVVRLHPQAPAAATSITQTGVYAGGCVGPLWFGFVATAYDYRVAWLIGAVAMLAAAALMVVGSRALARHAVTALSPTR